jgi:hypothetical protein
MPMTRYDFVLDVPEDVSPSLSPATQPLHMHLYTPARVFHTFAKSLACLNLHANAQDTICKCHSKRTYAQASSHMRAMYSFRWYWELCPGRWHLPQPISLSPPHVNEHLTILAVASHVRSWIDEKAMTYCECAVEERCLSISLPLSISLYLYVPLYIYIYLSRQRLGIKPPTSQDCFLY